MNKILHFIVFYFLLSIYAKAQPCFTLSDSAGCVPFTVTVIDCSTGSNPIYSYSGSSSDTTSLSTHTYTEPGTYTITQWVTVSGSTPSTSKTVTVYDTLPPKVEFSLCDNYEVAFNAPNVGYHVYYIDFGDGNSDTVFGGNLITHQYANDNTRTITITGRYLPENCGNTSIFSIKPILSIEKSNIDSLQILTADSLKLVFFTQQFVYYQMEMSTNGSPFTLLKDYISPSAAFSDTLSSLNNDSNTYCFRLISTEKCTPSSVAINSDVVCSLPFTATSSNNFNTLNWQNYEGDNLTNYSIYRNNLPIANANNSTTNFVDSSNIFCDKNYCYNLVANANNLRPSVSISNASCVVGKSDKIPPVVNDLKSTFNNKSEIILSWKKLERNPQKFIIKSTEFETEILDTFLIISSDLKNCYTVFYVDSCNNISQQAETCPIRLQAEVEGLFDIDLNWSEYKTFHSGFNDYTVNILSSVGNEINIATSIANYKFHTEINEQIFYIKIIGNGINDDEKTFSNIDTVVIPNRIIVPTAFSPNNNNLNDEFLPKARFVKEFKMSVYNKWGQHLFTTTDYNKGWKPENIPPDVYSYQIEIIDFEGNIDFKKGTITLIK